MLKLDLKRKYRHLLNPTPKAPTMVDVPALNYLWIEGSGDPNTSQVYQDAVNTLYSVAYTLKFMCKKGELEGQAPVDYPVMALEGLWWAEDMALFLDTPKDEWLWRMMIMQPDLITAQNVQQASEQAARKKELPALPRLQFGPYAEGLCAQIMHLGPYAAEGPTVQALHAFIKENRYQTNGRHHEIYLSDPRKAAPARMKTIVRQPICLAKPT
jgi:hypothetical protein